jgi:PAT family beta-lactamase induction signal transducer AmpG
MSVTSISINRNIRHPALWVPTSYWAEGIPFAMASAAAATMFKDLGHSDGEITVATASIGLAWSLKPLWAAFLDMYMTKKFYVVAMEFVMGVLLIGMALALPVPNYFQIIIAILWILAFASATQDICVDGVYITTLDKKRQSAWMGVQGVFWTLGRLFAISAIVWTAGRLERAGYSHKAAWAYALGVSAVTMALLGVYHYLILPTGSLSRGGGKDVEQVNSPWAIRGGVSAGCGIVLGVILAFIASSTIAIIIGIGTALSIAIGWREHVPPFLAFVRKKHIIGMLVFVFLYRTGEGFLLQEAPLFLQSAVDKGGIGLTLEQKSLIDGIVSTLVSLGAGLLGGAVAAKYGLKRVLLVLALCMNIPHLCYIFLSQAVHPGAPLPLWLVCVLVSIEKFGYSFGFVGNMLYMMQQIAPGKYKMTHYAYATAFMNLVLVPTQAASGKLADWMGYRPYFIFVAIASIPSIWAAWKAPFPNPKDEDGTESGAERVEPEQAGEPAIASA